MKKITLILVTLLIAVNINAQNLLKPLTTDMIMNKMELKTLGVGEVTNVWIPRISVAFTALAIDFSQKPVLSQSLSSVGFGMSFGRYSVINEKPYCDLSVNALLLTSIKIADIESTHLGIAATLGLFNNLINIGGGYINKKLLLLTMVAIPLPL